MSLGRQVRAEPGAKVVRTVCPQECGVACGILAHVKDGVLVKVEPGDFPPTSHICARGLSAPNLVYHPDRLKYPLRRAGERGEGKWQRISWDEALDTIALKLGEIGARHGPNSRAWILGGLGLVFTTAITGLPGACGGTFILPAGCGDSAGPCADIVSYGSWLWYGEDYTNLFENPRLCLLWGGNSAETEPFKWRRIRDAREKGARLVVIDPRFTTTASRADEHVPIRLGTDAALALGMMNVVLDKGLQDTSFITRYTVGPFLVRSDNGLFLRETDIGATDPEKYVVWDTEKDEPRSHDAPGVSAALTGAYNVNGVECRPAFQLLADLARQYPPERASEISEIPVDTITRLATQYATEKPAASYRGMGCTRGSLYGDLSFRAINTLAAVTGNISLRGHASFGVNMAAFMTRGIPNLMPLLQMNEAIVTGKPHPIKALWMAKTNLVNMNPNFNRFTRELVRHLELIVVADMFMTTSAQYADFVLPACSWFEYTDVVMPVGVGSHNYLQLQQKAIEPLYESRSDFDMLASLAKRMGLEGFMEESPEQAVELVLASGDPSMEGITLEKLKRGPVAPAPHSVPDFATPSGRLEFYSEKLKDFGQELPVYLEPLESSRRPLAATHPLSFMTAHPRLRSHSTFGKVAWLRELDPKPTLDMNPADAQPRRIQDGDLVRVFNDRGEVKLTAKVHQGIRPGLVNVCEGWSPGDYADGNHQALTHGTINAAQLAVHEPNAAFHDTLVQVERIEET